jgi:hypothetical protein
MQSKVNKWGTVLTVGAGCIALFWTALPALAVPQILERGRQLYSLGKETGKCDLCHNLDAAKNEEPSEDNINVYAKDLKNGEGMKKLHGIGEEDKLTEEQSAILNKAFKAIDDKDSDGDGATNREELMLAANPGDPKSVPAKDALEKFRKEKK